MSMVLKIIAFEVKAILSLIYDKNGASGRQRVKKRS